MLWNILSAGTLVCKLQVAPWTGGNGWNCRTRAVNWLQLPKDMETCGTAQQGGGWSHRDSAGPNEG